MADDVIPIMEETRTWKTLHDILQRALNDRLASCRNAEEDSLEDLQHFLGEHWPSHAPRQAEVAALEQRIKVLEREVEQRGEAIKAKNAQIDSLQERLDATDSWINTHKEGL